MIDCPYFRKCSAPLCPLDPESLEHGIWYPFEQVCRRRSAPEWVKVQKKIKRKTKNVNRYFTFEMLNRNCVISKGIVGLNPDSRDDEEKQLKKWFKNHPPKKSLSAEEKAEIRRRLQRNSKNKCELQRV